MLSIVTMVRLEWAIVEFFIVFVRFVMLNTDAMQYTLKGIITYFALELFNLSFRFAEVSPKANSIITNRHKLQRYLVSLLFASE